MKYRIFIEDVGPGKFSAYGRRDIVAESALDAIFKVTGVLRSSPIGTRWQRGEPPTIFRGSPEGWLRDGSRLIALPLNRRDLWPDGKTGKVPTEALKFR
jgi:hypothetical protein